MRRGLACLVLLALVGACPASAGYGRPVFLFNLKDTRITESSGVASYSRSGSVLWTHNDSGDIARFFAIGPKGETLETFDMLTVGTTAVDWEDMARGPGVDRKAALFFGDIGDNAAARPLVTVYEIPEPEIDFADVRETVQAGESAGPVRRLVYEDGPHDAETLFVHPKTGAIGVVTKSADGESGVYIAGEPNPAGIATLDRVATISFEKIARPYQLTDFGPESRLQTTGGDMSPDGKRLVVRTYVEAFEWNVSKGLAKGLKQPPLRIPLPRTNQGEAIAYTRDGRSLVTTTEQRPSPVHMVPS